MTPQHQNNTTPIDTISPAEITPERIVKMVPAHFLETSNMSREDWLELRRVNGIGGSDMPGLLGISKYSSPFRVWREKMGLEEEIPDSDIMWFGREIEPAMAERFQRESGIDVHHVKGMFIDNQYPFLFANIDRFVSDAEGNIGILEIKTTNKWNADTWDTEVDPSWLCQVYHYMGITGVSYAYIVYLIDRDFAWIKIERTKDVEANIKGLRNIAIDFHENHVITKVCPDPATIDEAASLWKEAVIGKEIEATNNIYSNVMELAKVKAQIKALNEQEKRLKDIVAVYMEDAEVLSYGGDPLLTYKTINKKGFEVKPTTFRQMNMKFKLEA